MKNKTIIFLFCGILICAGCSIFTPQKDHSVFYTLGSYNSNVEKESTESENCKFASKTIINLIVDEIPAYADYPYIVTKSEGHILNFSKINRWAEPLEYGCLRVIKSSLLEILGDCVEVISSVHADGNKVFCDYRLSVSIDDMIYNSEAKAIVLQCSWSLFDYKNKQQIYVFQFSENTPIDGDASCDNIVCAMQKALSQLASNIANKLTKLDVISKKCTNLAEN